MPLFAACGWAAESQTVRYSLDVQPIFAEHCFQCHGPDAEHREADLRLDIESAAKQSAIVAGEPDDSELLARVIDHDEDTRMPPPDATRLTDEQVDVLRRWIASGAAYEQHWAFRPIQSTTIPQTETALSDRPNQLPLSDIDRFVVARLNRESLSLSPPASKQQLIRRATFDLTGLPPTWEEVRDFESDTSPQAFEKVVDRLLDSAGYGERWGRHWLDLARYADTHGGAAIGFKRFAFSYTYRDYVIEAFRKHVPIDQFIVEQLAADQLELGQRDPRLAALGFLTVGMQFRNPHNIVDDQIDVISRGLMGLTVACARCHDHKFDAISTKDYYSLYAVLAASEVPTELPIIGDRMPSDYAAYEAELERLKTVHQDMARDQSEVMRGRLRMQVGLYLREIARGAPEPDLVSADVFSYRTDDLRPHVLHRWQTYIGNMSPDDPVFGPWVRLSTWVNTQQRDEDSPAQSFATRCAQLLAELREQNGELAKDFHRVATEPPRWNPRVIDALARAKPTSMLEVADAMGKLFGEVHREWLQAQLEASLEAIPGTKPIPDEDPKHLVINSAVNRQLRRHLYGQGTPFTMDDRLSSRQLNRPIKDNLSGRREAIHQLNLNSAGSPARAMIVTERSERRPFHVFVRGNPLQRGEPVVPRFLSVLGGRDDERFSKGRRRLELARAIVHPENPLTPRVIVNWVWQHHFARGIVRTPDDFGTRGEPPTHPELLDYLATKLVEEGWSLKPLHKRIMLSKVYQQQSVERPEARKRDPDNRLLWRMPRRRLDFEAMRDAMLFVSGELVPVETSGGRPFELLANPVVPKRTVYAFVNRDIVHPIMSTFDAANPNACTAKRPETTVPQQTLFALNSDFIQDRAAALATAASQAATQQNTQISNRDFVISLYRQTLTRHPEPPEVEMSLQFLNTESGNLQARRKQLAHVLLACNEFNFLD